MTVGSRLREERQRLDLSQPRLAAITGVAKNTAINWEKDVSSPSALALIAFAEAGADVLYILTGRRTNDGPDLSLTQISDQIAEVRSSLLNPLRYPLVGETPDQTEERVLKTQIEVLGLFKRHRADIGTPDQLEEIDSLYDIATDPVRLTAFRAADHAQNRSKRKRIRERIISYIEMNDRQPGDEAINIMVSISLEYNVPVGPLVDLALELLSERDDFDANAHEDDQSGTSTA